MKEIVYLDTDLMNSMLAQLEEGLITTISLEQNSQESETEGQQTTRGKNAGLNGQVKVGTGIFPGGELRLGASLGNNGNESTNESRTILEGQKDILNKAFHDYALEILIQRLEDSGRLKTGDDLKEGDLCMIESPYKFYDFELIQNLLDIEKIQKMLSSSFDEDDLAEAKKILKKTTPNAGNREKREWAATVVKTHENASAIAKSFRQMEMLSTYFTHALKGLSIVKAGNKIGVVKKDCLRESPVSLSLRPDKSRNIKILMRCIGIKGGVYTGQDKPELQPQDFDAIPNMIFDIMLGSFNILKQGDALVTPIAIYYE